MPQAVIAITENMVKAGLQVLEEHLDDTPVEGSDEEGPSDTQLVIQMFTAMWKIHCAEVEAIRNGKQPKIIKPPVNALIMPTPRGH